MAMAFVSSSVILDVERFTTSPINPAAAANRLCPVLRKSATSDWIIWHWGTGTQPGWGQPTAALPLVIYNYALSPYEDWHRQAWAAGLVLLGLILTVNIVARVILSRGVAVPRS